MQAGVAGTLHDQQRVAREILAGDEPWIVTGALAPADTEPPALAERVALEAAVPPDHLAVFGLDRAGLRGQPASDEIAEGPLADEADAGRIALVRDRQAPVARDAPHLGLGEAADRELAGSELRSIERVQEVALVLGAVDAAQQPAVVDAGIVPRREALGAQPARVIEANAELHFAVAEHVGIRRTASREFGQEILEHARAIFRSETHAVQGYSKFLRDRPGVLEVGCGGAIAVVVLGPVGHEQRLDLPAGVDEQRGGDGGIHPARHRHDHAGHGSARNRAQRGPGKWHVAQHLERVARAAQVVVDAQGHERAAVLRQARCKLPAVQPERADDRAVEGSPWRRLVDLARKRDPQDHAPGRALPLVDAGHRLRREPATGLLAGLANHRVEQRLARLDVTRRLIEDDPPCGAFLHEQEAAVGFGDRRDGEVELQGHRGSIRRRWCIYGGV